LSNCLDWRRRERTADQTELGWLQTELRQAWRSWWRRWSFGIMELSAHSGHEDLPCFGLAQVHPR
jgi:hypothetical protein